MNARTLLVAFTLVVLTLLIWQLRWVLLVLFGAVVLAVALDVLIHQLQKRTNWQRPLSLAVVLLALLIGGVVVWQQLVPELITQIEQLAEDLPMLMAKLGSMLGENPVLMDLETSFSWNQLRPLGTQLLGFAGGAANSLIQVFLMSLLAVLLTLDPASHRRMVLAGTPRPAREEVAELLDRCRLALGGWLAGMTLSAVAVFLLTWAGLILLGAPLALLSALVCGMLTFVPTIGPTAATLLPVGLALLVSPTLTLQVLVLRLVLQNLEAFLMTP
ncbi:MAG TPA: AI-2E family transporter, partial [Prochlorococcaceae cyanobacterium Fu_MAG_50]|nr:AI-2E family transporter [Prochlorococcaceae cyanobacterium Fu_MAG_50]